MSTKMKAKNKAKERKKNMIMDKLKGVIQNSEYTEVYAWGSNEHGQLGVAKIMNQLSSFISQSKICSFSIKISEIGKTLTLYI